MLFSACIVSSAQTRQERVSTLLASAKLQTKHQSGPPLIGNDGGLPLLFSADSLARTTNDTLGQAATADQLGMFYQSKDADKSIKYYLQAYPLYISVNNPKRAANCFNNLAFLYDEQKHNYPEAIKYATMSVNTRRALMDTLGTGSMCKYLGSLQARTHEYSNATKNITEAIRLFSLKKYKPGIAACYRDIAMVYEEQGKTDSCIANIMYAKEIWEGTNDTVHLFDANNILLRVYTTSNKLQDAATILHKNEAMMNARAMQNVRRTHTAVCDHYKACQAFFTKKKNEKMATEYAYKYTAYKEMLKQQGFNTDK